MSLALKIGGSLHDGWKSIIVNRSIETISGAFQLSITDKWGDGSTAPRQIKPFDACEVLIDGQTVITGYIDGADPSYDGYTHTITISGRDKAGDLVDCSVANGTGEWKGLKLETLVARICEPFGITVKTEVDTGLPIATFNAEQGMTAFEAIQKVCALRACLAISDKAGGLIITRAGQSAINAQLVEGQNIKSASGKLNTTERFSHYICKGQQQGNDNLSASAITGPSATVTDEYVTRYRPLIIVADGQASTANCQTRARWEAAVRRGKSQTFTVTVNGWKTENGELWDINKLVKLKSPWLTADGTYLIAGINYRLDERGELTELALTPAETYALIPENKIKKEKKGGSGTGENKYIEG